MPTAEQLERARDLKSQIQELRGEPDQEIVFKETSPRRPRIRLYSMTDGEPIDVPDYIAEKALEKRRPDGKFLFTIRQDDAPTYKQGTVKCFLHAESIERESGALDQVGLNGIVCEAGKLASLYSKRIHAQHRHRQQWEAYQEYVLTVKELERDERQQSQIDATLELARAATGGAAETPAKAAKEK